MPDLLESRFGSVGFLVIWVARANGRLLVWIAAFARWAASMLGGIGVFSRADAILVGLDGASAVDVCLYPDRSSCLAFTCMQRPTSRLSLVRSTASAPSHHVCHIGDRLLYS